MNAIDPIHAEAQGIRLSGVTKSYDAKAVTIPPMDIEMRAGEFTVILGPSGCGKSTLLQMIAGLERVTGGTISIGGREVQDLEPKERGLAMVFQNYALYPHMTVAQNIGYSLRVAGIQRAERDARVKAVARMLGLADFLHRKPGQLSGGQRQRVAIGRAIIREPGVLLFDEPLSNLDAQLRQDMRLELAELHHRIGATSIFVTHDQVEAMTLADRILILNKGRVEQFDTPKTIYSRPASIFVAKFIGAPPMNILPVSGDGRALRFGNGKVFAASPLKGEFLLGIRPESIVLDRHGPIRAQLRHREDLGSHMILTAAFDLVDLRIALPFGSAEPQQSDLHLHFPRECLHLFDVEGRRIEADFHLEYAN
ncbi:ABC transporter ATP-binding protein [Paracoccus alkanivorans]|uniref:sn-glycerol-3-phosphate ABC transporter ATP-binding protein UgpC n=1 Tax=Paracoccus alkanivorans TaxID=2116655 RepID=A0A3M0MHL7_9RHOB|nr:sn-glycerol-3-phosphate ABC transporter ATP-binding protein UgpC [Paracoccus alkanivorans]RMC37216.1 sn-glycerol-3-phosphate ABC transporter ATP-binding protein UgpC [Paracoccus alkanivorans]